MRSSLWRRYPQFEPGLGEPDPQLIGAEVRTGSKIQTSYSEDPISKLVPVHCSLFNMRVVLFSILFTYTFAGPGLFPWSSVQNIYESIPSKVQIADSIVETAVASDFLNLIVAEVMKRQTKAPIPNFLITRFVTQNAIRVGLRGAIWYYVDLDESKKQLVTMESIMGDALKKSSLPEKYITDTLIADLIAALEKEGYNKEGILLKFAQL